MDEDRTGPTIVDLVRLRVIDAELGGLLWVLLDGGVPVVVAGPGDDPMAVAARVTVLAAILDLVPAGRRRRQLAGEAEDFAWLGPAEALGWRRSTPAAAEPDDPATTVILAGELGAPPPLGSAGDRARLLIRAAGRGYAVAATAQAGRLEDLLALLRQRPIRLTDDELAALGTVLVLDAGPLGEPTSEGSPVPGASVLRRVVAAHELRPVARDVHGHPQRLPPAVLATWDERIARFEHFSWGIAAELAARVGRRTGDFELERARRAAVLEALAAGVEPETAGAPKIRLALERARLAESTAPPLREH